MVTEHIFGLYNTEQIPTAVDRLTALLEMAEEKYSFLLTCSHSSVIISIVYLTPHQKLKGKHELCLWLVNLFCQELLFTWGKIHISIFFTLSVNTKYFSYILSGHK